MKKSTRRNLTNGYGFVKRNGKVYTSVCVNMSLFGQGKTKEESKKNLMRSINSMVKYLKYKYKKNYRSYLFKDPTIISQGTYEDSKKEDRFVITI